MSYKEIKGMYATFTFAGFDVYFARDNFPKEGRYSEWEIQRVERPSTPALFDGMWFDGTSKYTTTKLTIDSARRLFNCFCRDMVKRNNVEIEVLCNENELLGFGAATVKSRKQRAAHHKKMKKWIDNLP